MITENTIPLPKSQAYSLEVINMLLLKLCRIEYRIEDRLAYFYR